MKKSTLLLFAFTITSSLFSQEDKAFHKGIITVDPNIGFAVYGTKVHTEYDEDYWTGTAIATRRVTNDTTDGAGAGIYGLNAEYGVTNWLGLGVRFAYLNYIEETQHDTVYSFPTGMQTFTYKPKARGIDFGADVNIHLVKGKRFDMPLCLMMGYSNFRYWQNNPDTDLSNYDNSDSQAKDNGMYYGILLVPKIYLGKEQHVGIRFHIGYLGQRYGSLQFSNTTDSDLNSKNNWEYRLKGSGFNMGIGLSLKFGAGTGASVSVK